MIAAGVGAMLHELRKRADMSVRDVEIRSGVTRSTVSRLEHGQRRPRRSTLAWIAWALDAERVVPLTRQLCESAGLSLIAESPWSERTHKRHALRNLGAGLPVPAALFAPYAVAALGGIYPGEIDRLRQVQELARRGDLPWPPGLVGSAEALAVANHLANLTPGNIARIAANVDKINDWPAFKERQRRQRVLKAIERESYTAMRQRRGGHAGGRIVAQAMTLQRATEGLMAADRMMRGD
jgi:transcriptional regulator with XRE-family HTH domain